ncbi:MAG: hypothetical protein ABF379_06380 [Akkermansiaceae bacterium]|jgi:uncharacterized protein (DUF1330 family)
MKKLLTAALLLTASVGSLFGAKEARILIITDKDTFTGWMMDSNKSKFLWRETQQTLVNREQSLRTCTVYFLQAPEFTEALELYKSRNYKSAALKFAVCAEEYNKLTEVKGNPSAMASFYEMECYRRLEDLEKLSELAGKFEPENLLYKFQKVQYEMYGVFWDAVRTKSWSRLDAICRDEKWRGRKLPGNLRGQIAYCHGLALEGAGQPVKALNAYNNAFVADFASSEEITRKSAVNCLRIILDHKDVKTAMELYSSEDYSDDSNGAALIKEATALLKLWDKVLGSGEKVPAKYKVFLKYPPKNK